jgi:hypothetical protein
MVDNSKISAVSGAISSIFVTGKNVVHEREHCSSNRRRENVEDYMCSGEGIQQNDNER